MKTFGFGFVEALRFAKSKREIVEPNDGFQEQLIEWKRNNFSVDAVGLPFIFDEVMVICNNMSKINKDHNYLEKT